MTTTSTTPCICGKHMLEELNEGTCLWCGHGNAHNIHTVQDKQLAQLPRDLGGYQREGRRPPYGVFENVTRLKTRPRAPRPPAALAIAA